MTTAGMDKANPQTKPRHWLLAYVAGRGRTLSWMLLLAALLAGGTWLLWQQVRQRVLAGPDYQMGPEDVTITPLPPWIHSNVCAEVLRDASLDPPLSIMDKDLVERVAGAFSFHPWVAKVVRVRKRHPARVEVELVYRRPVCMVEVQGGLLPVDAEGILLPSVDFSPVEASRYPRLVGVESVPLGPVGARWGDERVGGAAEIAASLIDAWHELRLDHIAAIAAVRQGHQQEYTYELWTQGGSRIYWGLAPSTTSPSEMPAAEKVARLREYVAEHGDFEQHQGPQRYDVRDLPLPAARLQTPT